jgi:hypothetical protein
LSAAGIKHDYAGSVVNGRKVQESNSIGIKKQGYCAGRHQKGTDTVTDAVKSYLQSQGHRAVIDAI